MWFPTTCPFSSTFSKIVGYFSALSPTQKKVALALYFSSISKIFGVTSGIGPSSKVKYTTFSSVGKDQMRSLARGLSMLGVLVRYTWQDTMVPTVLSNFPSIMKAVVLKKIGKANEAFEIREVQDPEPKEGEVVVQVEAFGLNFADVMARNGLYREAPPLPSILGYDFVGRVIKTTSKDHAHLLNKRVAGLSRFGSYAELVATRAEGMVVIPEHFDAAKSTALGTQYATAFHSACQMTNLQKGDKVLIHAAAGGVGTALIQLARWKGCTIFGTVGSDDKAQHILDLGADYAINYRESDYEQKIKEILKGERLDLTFNPIAGSTFKKDMRLLGSAGRMILFGAAERSGMKGGKLATFKFLWKMGLMMPILLMAKSRSIIGVNMLKVADHKPQLIGDALLELTKLLEQEIIDPQIGGVFDVKDIAKAHDLLERRKTKGKIAVKW